MFPPSRALTLAKADCRAFLPVEHPGRRGASTKADVRGHSLTSDLCPLTSGLAPNTKNRSAAGRIRRGEQRITAKGGTAISAFQRLQRFALTSDFRPLTSGFTLIELVVVMLIIATLAALVT